MSKFSTKKCSLDAYQISIANHKHEKFTQNIFKIFLRFFVFSKFLEIFGDFWNFLELFLEIFKRYSEKFRNLFGVIFGNI